MNAKRKAAIVQQLVRLVDNTSEPFKEGRGRTKHIMSEGIAFSLTNEFVDTFDDVARTLLQDEG
jgi:hypothetical protein